LFILNNVSVRGFALIQEEFCQFTTGLTLSAEVPIIISQIGTIKPPIKRHIEGILVSVVGPATGP
jgi:hypothetical protein